MGKKLMRLGKFAGFILMIIVGSFIVLVVWPLSYFTYPESQYAILIIDNVSVIDIEEDTIYQNRHVIIRDGTIEKIVDSNSQYDERKWEKVKRINGSGQFLLPALWDMHVHLTNRSPHIAYPAFLSHGVTYVRDMRGAYDERDPFAGVQSRLEKWNSEVKNHKLIGPSLHSFASFAVEGPHEMFKGSPSFFICSTPADAVNLVQYLKKRNVTLIKIYNHVPREAFFALMQ